MKRNRTKYYSHPKKLEPCERVSTTNAKPTLPTKEKAKQEQSKAKQEEPKQEQAKTKQEEPKQEQTNQENLQQDPPHPAPTRRTTSPTPFDSTTQPTHVHLCQRTVAFTHYDERMGSVRTIRTTALSTQE